MSSPKVVNLNDHRPHNSGVAVCMCCKHEWNACAPIGTTDLECPKCHTMKGHFKFECARLAPHWQCVCGNFYFCIIPAGSYCPNCGEMTVND